MNQPPRNVFAGRSFMFWTLSPIFLLFAICLGWVAGTAAWAGDTKTALISALVAIVFVCGILALLDGARFAWAARVVSGAIFIAYLVYAIDEWFFSEHAFVWSQPSSTASPKNALLGLLVIGGPALWFTITGGFSARRKVKRAVRNPGPAGGLEVEVLAPAPRNQRPFFPHEREILQAAAVYERPDFKRSLACFGVWAFSFVSSLSLFFWLLSVIEGGPGWMGIVLPVACITSILTFYAAYAVAGSYFDRRRGERQFAMSYASLLQVAIAGGDASVISVEARSVIVIDDENSGDTTWLFELESGNTFFLRGDDYYPVEEDMPWPAKRFQIVRAAANDHLIGLFTEGASLEPDRYVDASEMPEEYLWADEPKSECILAGNPAENLRRFGQAAGVEAEG